jgi:hypothetical protein
VEKEADAMEGKRIVDASGAQMAARRHWEAQHGDKLLELKVRKCWYSTRASRDVQQGAKNFQISN